MISNGPFYLESYSPESRTITVNSFDDETYPFSVGHWSEFESAKIPKIMKAQIPNIVNKESEFEINIQTLQADSILYFVSNSNGEIISSNSILIGLMQLSSGGIGITTFSPGGINIELGGKSI